MPELVKQHIIAGQKSSGPAAEKRVGRRVALERCAGMQTWLKGW